MKEISYALGMNIASNLKSSGVESLDLDEFVKGLTASMQGEKTKMTTQEANMLLQEYFTTLQNKQYSANIEAGKEFLANNAKKDTVTELESGLQYEILKEGNGPKPKATDQVKCHYHGTLIDGTVFDSSVERGEPAVFPVNGVIQGWVEALQMMPTGSKWRLYIPSELAYGERGAGQTIAPHSTLIFDVELLEIL
ncbi:MAG: FKBP-type peptidyl-prolyl cis-trans isomerase [Chlorobi bacterium]|nr:FKBP-type peptidyl-prolyl cis-trans isomerase [Chlorobiota bacterium]